MDTLVCFPTLNTDSVGQHLWEIKMIEKAISQYRLGILDKDEIFIIRARSVDPSGKCIGYTSLTASERMEFVEWIRANILGASSFAVGGVGELFTENEVNKIRQWFDGFGSEKHKA